MKNFLRVTLLTIMLVFTTGIAKAQEYTFEEINIKESMLYSNAPCTVTQYGDDFKGWHVLFDGNPTTIFHSEYGSGTSTDGLDHYWRVDMGKDNRLSTFKFKIQTRDKNSEVNSPTTIVVEGSNEDGGRGTYTEIKTITGITQQNSTWYESDVLGQHGIKYRYIRFRVTATGYNQTDGGGKKFFFISEFRMSKAIAPVRSDYVHNTGNIVDNRAEGSKRKLNSFKLTDGTNYLEVTNIQETYTSPVYSDKTESKLRTYAGATLSFSAFSYAGSWMHAYAYVDYDKDRYFTLAKNNDGTTEGEIVSYNYYNEKTITGDTGDENGNALSNEYNGSKAMPAFTLPANLKPGEYRMRIKVDWDNLDADYGASSIAQNSGCQCDITLVIGPKSYTVTATAGNGGTVSPTTENVIDGNSIELTATPNPGFTFTGWYNGNDLVSEENPYTFTPEANVSYTARFEQNIITSCDDFLTNFENGKIYYFETSRGVLAAMEGNSNLVSTARKTIENLGMGNPYCQWTVYKSEDNKYYLYNIGKSMFMGSTTTNNGVIPFTEKPINDGLVFKATDKEGFPIMFTCNTNTGAVNHSKHNDHTEGIVYWEAGWDKLDDDGNCHKVTLVGELDSSTLEAIAAAVAEVNANYSISVTAGEGGSASTSATTVKYGNNVTLTATPNVNYKFVGWYNGETKVSEANPYTFAVTSDIRYEARFEVFPDGAYKIYWQADNRGYLAYHTDYLNEAKLADVTLGNWGSSHYNSSTDQVNLVWYLITASDGKRYLFEVETGKLLGVGTEKIGADEIANKLSTTEAWPIAIEPNPNHPGHYIITTKINSTKNLLCSGCATDKTGHPVRWIPTSEKNLSDGGAPLQLVPVNDVTVANNVMNAVRPFIEPRTFKFKAVVENWKDNNPNTHLGTITIGGTPLKLTPDHLTVSEHTMPLAEGTTLAFTRKYRGFDFNGFYIGTTELGENPTLTADNVAAIDENNPLIAKFTATDDVTLFYDDDDFSYRIPAIVKTSTGRLIAVSDYRHNLDDIGRDKHGTGKMRIDLVARMSDNNGETWTAKQTIAAGDESKKGSYQRAYGDAAIAAVGENIIVMAAAGDVMYSSASATNTNKMVRVFSSDNGANWTIEDMTTKMYSTSKSLFPNHFSAFFGSGKLAVDNNFNGTNNARIYGALLMKNSSSSYNNFVVYSDDLGANWHILGGSQDAIAGGDEPKVEILPSGQILLSARRQGGRIFRVFTYGTDKANGEGSWGDAAVNGCYNGGSNGTNGEIICLDAKKPNGKATKILLQSQPKGGSGHYERYNVTIWYKEITDEAQTPSSIANGWTQGLEVCPAGIKSAYSAMALQENGEIAFFFEEAPCYADNHEKGYSMVYVPLTIEEITNNNFLNPNADVETVTVDVTLTDGEGNTYTHQFDYLPGDAAAIDAALLNAYPFITELGEGNLQGSDTYYTYTNTVTLPFKVSNANTTIWHNIYFPAYDNAVGYPVYMMAKEESNLIKIIAERKDYGASQYNTLAYADKLGWAIYSVNNTLTFKFKNQAKNSYIKTTTSATNAHGGENVQFTDNIDEATAFSITDGRSNTYRGEYGITSGSGCICVWSYSDDDLTYTTNNTHQGAWAKFVEAPDYQGIVDKLIADINNFGEGEGKYVANDAIPALTENALRTTPINTLRAHTETVKTVKDSYTEITLSIPVANSGSVKILEEAVSHKFVPKGEVTIEAVPAGGYRFVNWTRPAAAASAAARTAEARNAVKVVITDNPYTFNLTDAVSLEANFEEILVNVTLTDERGNIYNVTLGGFTNGVTKETVAAKLVEKYPYITLGTADGGITLEGGDAAYTYTNTVELPFKVTNTTYIWHNIYWPSNTKAYDYPIYWSASSAEDTYVPKVTDNCAYGAHSTYNTKDGNDKISWAIYNVDNSFKFIFKNKVTQKYIKVTSVAEGNAQNVVYVENAEDATAFTIEKKPAGNEYDTPAQYSLAAYVGETKGYLCSSSAGYGYATHHKSNGHQGAWIEFVESPDYFTKIMDIGIILGLKFGAGDGKCIITEDIQEIIDAMQNSGSITLNNLTEYASRQEDAMNNWPAISLTINPEDCGTTSINGEENVKHKYIPNGYELALVATPAEGYHFDKWIDGTSEITTAEYTKTISGGKGDVIELTVNFAKNSYYRIGYDFNSNRYYIQSEASGVSGKKNALKMTQETGAASIFYYAEKKLLSYDKGTYVKEDGTTRGLQAVGTSGTVTITTTGETSTIAAPSYMHANSVTSGTNTTYFIDHCGSNTGTDAHANHNFVLEEVTTLPVTISSALHATFYAPVAVAVPEGVKAYVLKEKNITTDTWVTMTLLQNRIIPANTGVILKSEEAKTYDFIITENTDEARLEAEGNILEGTVAKSSVNKDAYILTKKSNGVGMYPLSNNSYLTDGTTPATFTNNSHKAYLPVEGNFAKLLQQGTGFRFTFDDGNATEVEDIETEVEDTIYDLQGRKLSEITKPGIYIVNGKKVWIK